MIMLQLEGGTTKETLKQRRILFSYRLIMTSNKSVKYVVIGWTKKGEEDLANELLEVNAVSKLIVKGSAVVGTEVCLQHKNDL